MRTLYGTHELAVLCVWVLPVLLIGAVNAAFCPLRNVFDLVPLGSREGAQGGAP
jgi:hypothetical protein